MNGKAVIGTNFGDEGKGHMVDYLSSVQGNCLVIRHSGGAQSGHTVVEPNGNKHVFGHFGAGTYSGVPTYLSKFFLINPIMFMEEYLDFSQHNDDIPINIFIHEDCLVTTPFDMMLNQMLEIERSGKKHGSCGAGIHETMVRSDNDRYKLTIKSFMGMSPIQQDSFFRRLLIKEYFINRIKELNISDDTFDKYKIPFESQNTIDVFIADLMSFIGSVTIIEKKDETEFLNDFNTLIFEGSQGLSLDANHKYFPYVTHANTGSKNIIQIIEDNNLKFDEFEIIYTSRCYITRHGTGPLPNELEMRPFSRINDSTNVPNTFQGSLRFSYINTKELNENISNDYLLYKNMNEKIKNITCSLALTCLDHISPTEDFCYYNNNNELIKIKNDIYKIKDHLTNCLNIPVKYTTTGLTREHVQLS